MDIKIWEEWRKHWSRTENISQLNQWSTITFHNYSLLTRLLSNVHTQPRQCITPTTAQGFVLQSKANHISRPSTLSPYMPAKLAFSVPSSSTSFLPQDPSTLFPVSGNWHPGFFFYQVNPNRPSNLSLNVTVPLQSNLVSQPLNSLLKYLAHTETWVCVYLIDTYFPIRPFPES